MEEFRVTALSEDFLYGISRVLRRKSCNLLTCPVFGEYEYFLISAYREHEMRYLYEPRVEFQRACEGIPSRLTIQKNGRNYRFLLEDVEEIPKEEFIKLVSRNRLERILTALSLSN